MAEAGVVGDDAVEAGEEGGEGVLAEEEDEGDGGSDEVGERGGGRARRFRAAESPACGEGHRGRERVGRGVSGRAVGLMVTAMPESRPKAAAGQQRMSADGE